jgi:hypothetical protein
MTSPTEEDSPTEDEDKVAVNEGRSVASNVAVRPFGSFNLQPRARILVSFGPKTIGDAEEINNGLPLSDVGMMAPEWRGWNSADFTKDVADDDET